MKKAILAIIVLVSVMLLVGCQQPADQQTNDDTMADGDQQATADGDGDTEADGDGDSDGDGDTTTTTVSDGDTDVTVTTTEGTDDWCSAGSTWSMDMQGEESGFANWEVLGIMDSGEYAGYCHITYEYAVGEDTMNVDLYLTEDEGGFMVMEANGQTITQE